MGSLDSLAYIVAVDAIIAAAWGLEGTNAQARLAKQRLFEDDDPLVAAAGRLWQPGPRWLRRRKHRERWEAAEAKIRADDTRWKRYERLRAELRAWNLLESSVAMAFTVAIGAAVIYFFG